MKIRTQNLFSILPVFISLALICGALLYYVERQERLWGLSEEAKTSALSIAEFTAQRYNDASAPVYLPKNDPQYMLAMERILSHGRVLRIYEITPDSRQVVWGVPAKPVEFISNKNRSALTSEMVRDGGYVSDIIKPDVDRALIRGFAPMLNKDGKLLGSIGVDIDATSYVKDMHTLTVDLAWMGAVVILIGFIVVYYISQIITRDVNGLSSAASNILKGNLESGVTDDPGGKITDIRITEGRLQEVADLSNTFNTMNDVLQDILSRSKRTMIEGEQFRSNAELANAYLERYRPPISVTLNGLRIAANAVGVSPGAFWDVFEYDGSAYVILGQINGGDSLTSAVSAASVKEFLVNRIKSSGIDSAISDVNAIFKPESLAVKSIKAGSEIQQGRLILHTFNNSLKKQIDDYMDVVDDIPADDIILDIIAAIPSHITGALLIVTRNIST